MNNKAIIDMISYYKDEPMVQHTLKVFGYAQAIAAGEGIEGSEKDIIEYAALFHDVGIPAGIRECGSGAGPIQERLGAPIAMELAKPYLSAEQVERVGDLVGRHHSFGIKGQRALLVLGEAEWLDDGKGIKRNWPVCMWSARPSETLAKSRRARGKRWKNVM